MKFTQNATFNWIYKYASFSKKELPVQNCLTASHNNHHLSFHCHGLSFVGQEMELVVIMSLSVVTRLYGGSTKISQHILALSRFDFDAQLSINRCA